MKKLFGKRLKELRIKRGLTQEQLASLVDIGVRNLSKIECGVNFVTSETIEKLANVLNINIKELFDFEHLEDNSVKKEKLIQSIEKDEIDINLLFKIYQAIHK